jgi:hypothetical protein
MASQKNRLHRLFGFSLPDWKEASIQPDDVAELQVIRAGLARTGTSSLKAALEIPGFDPCHHMVVSSLHIKSQRASIVTATMIHVGMCPRPQTRLSLHRAAAPTRRSTRPPSINCSHRQRPQSTHARLQSHRGRARRRRFRFRNGIPLPQRKGPPFSPRLR